MVVCLCLVGIVKYLCYGIAISLLEKNYIVECCLILYSNYLNLIYLI